MSLELTYTKNFKDTISFNRRKHTMSTERKLKVFYQDETGETMEYTPQKPDSLLFDCNMSPHLCSASRNGLSDVTPLMCCLDNYTVVYLETPWSYPETVYQYNP